MPDPDVRVLLGPGDVASVLQTLERAATADHLGTRGLLASTLAGAFRECVALMGSDPSGWAWGILHRWKVSHALSPLALGGSLGAADVGPFAIGGSDSTVMKGVYRASDFRVVLGASVRLVIDVGEWDRSVWINTPGQSGDPRSAHYADLAPLWARGEYVPMCYSRDAVGAVTEMTITLTPGEIA